MEAIKVCDHVFAFKVDRRKYMKDDLTKEERALLLYIEVADKWDYLLQDLSLLIPSSIIIGLGVYYNSPVVIVIGMVVYASFAIRSTFNQVKMLKVLKSLLHKLSLEKDTPT